MNVFVSFLKNNPKLLNKYVSLGFSIVDKTVSPINKIMVHLLEVQGIDPKTQPGSVFRQALNKAVDIVDTEEYDDDFQFSRFHARFQKVANKLVGLNLTADKFRKITDLSLLSDNSVKNLSVTRDPVEVTSGAFPKVEEKPLQITKSENATKVDVARAPVATGTPKKTKKSSKITKSFKNGSFRRVE